MIKPKAYVINGLGIGCHAEAAHAYQRAGADAEVVHIRQLLAGGKDFLFMSQILNLSGGFLHGDILGAGMCAANELEHSGIKDLLLEYAEKGNVIYGQCNGFQLLVKTGLLPGIDNDYARQTVTLTHNDCGIYRVSPVRHKVEKKHFAFEGIDDSDLLLWCRHGEGKLMFYSDSGLVSKEEGEENRRKVNEKHVLLRYVSPDGKTAEKFPYNPNGSVDGIAGLVNLNGQIFAHMAHTEVSIYSSRDPRWFFEKDRLRREGIQIDEKNLEGIALKIFQNIVNHVNGGK
jgi:phosphoribosylformylglycinamidine synthase